MTTKRVPKLAALIVAVMLAVTPAAAQDNTAVAINTHDGMEIFRFAFKITRTMKDVVDNTNAAAAVSSCTECETIAVALQVVLIMSDPSVVTTENLAIALNIQCSGCETLASAYQIVMTTGGPVHFTAEGNRKIAELRKRLIELLRSDLSFDELLAALDILVAELKEVLANELVAAGPREDAATTSEPTTEPITTPEPVDSPSPTDSPTTESSPTPTS